MVDYTYLDYIYLYSREIAAVIIVILIFLYLFRISRKISTVDKRMAEISESVEKLKDDVDFVREYSLEISRDTSYLKGLMVGREEEKH